MVWLVYKTPNGPLKRSFGRDAGRLAIDDSVFSASNPFKALPTVSRPRLAAIVRAMAICCDSIIRNQSLTSSHVPRGELHTCK